MTIDGASFTEIARDRARQGSHTWRVAALLFGSGACALIYQIGWLREFRLIFGASTAASAAVLAIFIGGLGCGGLLIGPRADRHPRPLALYSQLETIVAIAAAASPLLLSLIRVLYIAVGGSTTLGAAGGTLVRLLLSALVLAVPTIVMGGTLPAAARSVTHAGDARRQETATLYALNTLGAVLGCLVSTFFMLEIFGTRATLWLAAGVNLLIAMFARQLDRSRPEEPESAEDATPGPASADPFPTPHDGPETAPAALVVVAAGVVGFAFFLMELVWYRMLGPLLGGSVFTFGLVLAVALVGIGAGGLLYALIAGERPASLSGFASTCLVEAVAIAATYALGDRIAVLTLVLIPLGGAGFGARVAGWAIVIGLTVLVPALAAGYQFPMLIALLGRGRARLGRQVGLAYAANTLGAMIGSLGGGFGLLPWLSAPGAWRLAAGSLVILGLATIARLMRRGEWWTVVPHLALAGAAAAMIAATGPSPVWRHSAIGAGRARLTTITSINQLREWTQAVHRWIIWEGDGTESSVALARETAGYAFLVNGKSDGSARGDAGTQVMLGLLGAIRNPRATRALVIGLGTGSSAGWLGVVPEMERVDVVELESLVLDVAKACREVNHDVLDNPKVHVTIGDAREILLTTKARYDIIASEPSNPYRAGVASLFTLEYYRAALDRLTDDGVFAQWVQGYEIDSATLRTVYRTMASTFGFVETWQTSRGDLVLLGAKHPFRTTAATLSARIGQEPFKSALQHVWRVVDVHGLLAHYVAGDGLARAIERRTQVDLNSDDRNVVEFGFARSVGRSGFAMIPEVRAAARRLGAGRLPLEESAGVNWDAVDTAWISYHASEDYFVGVAPLGPPAEQARQTALLNFYQRHDSIAARDAWRRQSGPPRDPTELAMLADIDAQAGSDEALAYIEALRAYQPGEADTILAGLRMRQSRDEEAARGLEAAFRNFRVDPWATLRFKQKAVSLASDLADRGPAFGRRMYEAIKEPFAIVAINEERLTTAAHITRSFDFAARCRESLAQLEPYVPWNLPFLTLRRDCYQATSDPRLQTALDDLTTFAGNEAVPFGSDIAVSNR